jgi:RNA polymerase sigma-70 factor (ECF subfamily)
VSHEEAQDAVQEVVLKLWVQKEKMINYRNIEAFAMTMTKNYCLDRLKSKQAGNLQLIHSNYWDQERLEKKIEDRESVMLLNRLMEDLPIQQQMIVQLRDVEQFDFKQIAEIMNMSQGAIRVALSRARNTLKKALLKIHEYGT